MFNSGLFVFNFIHGLSGKFWLFDWLGVFCAEYLPYLMVFFTLFILIKEKSWRQRIYFFSLAGLSVILARGFITEIIRFIHYRPRPFLALGFQSLLGNSDVAGSFPSGHATAYFALALAVFYFNKKWGWWFLIAAIVMGIARVFIGVHWPSDILVGALIGLVSAFVVKKILPEQSKPA